MTVDLDRQLKALRAGDHLCLIYDDPAQQLAALVPFIKEGMTRGERCVCSTVEQGSAEVAQALSAAGVDVEHERQRGALQLWTARDIYLASGKFDPQGMIAFLRELTEQTVAAGYPALRITGEMTWALGPEPGCDRLIEYESLLNHFIPRAPVLALCRYDRARFAPTLIQDVLRTHPIAILGEQVCSNPYFEPPELVLGQANAPQGNGPAQRVDWMIAQLQRAWTVEREREALVEQLRRERTFLDAVVRQMPAGVLIVDAATGKITLSNERIHKVRGLPIKEGDTLASLCGWQSFRLDGRPYLRDEWPLIRSLQTGEVVNDEEMDFIRTDGSRGTISINCGPIRDSQGRIIAGVLTASDISARKRTDEAMRESEARYRTIFEAGPTPMLVFDWQTLHFLAVNDAAVANYGYSRDEFLGMTILDIHPPEDLPRLRKHFAGPAPVGKVGMWRHRKKNGAIIDVEIAGHYIKLGRTLARLVLAQDITDKKRTEEALRASETRYRSLIENLEQCVFLKDRELRLLAVNRPFCEFAGRPEAEIIGRTASDLWPAAAAEKFHAADHRVLTHGDRVEYEETLPARGKSRIVRIVKTPVKDEDGDIIGVLGIFWDVTEQRTLEAQLRQAQKMEAIGLLAGGVAHDFNNLLAVIGGNIALTLGSLPVGHPNRELLLAAERAGVQAAELTNRLLGFARQTMLRPVPTQLRSCMEETARIVHRTFDPRITLEVRTTADLWTVEADANQINQVLLNLCINARDAMPEGGRLSLAADNVVLDAEYAREHVDARAGDFVRLSVGDTGHGIPPEIRSRIFEPFFTTKPPGKGTGLGLAMVFGIVTQHQGWIECWSEVGQGTRFEIFLPRHSQAVAREAPAPKAPQAPRGGRETILLADDEPMIRKLGRTILERYGYQVLLADDGLEAVEIFQREQSHIDLVILDLTMPRLSGHDALKQLVQIDPGVRVLFASGYSAEHLIQQQQEQVLGFLSKPFRPEQLARTVREILDRSGQ